MNTTPAFERWRASLSEFTGLGLNEEEKADRERRKEEGNLERDWDRCEKWKSDLMTRSTFTFLTSLPATRWAHRSV